MTEFEEFQEEFKKYQKLFGLTGYKVYFKFEPIDSFANITVNQTDMVATVRLNSRCPKKDKALRNIKQSAKHEAIHLLTMRLESCARYRYVGEGDISEASEELVFKLENLIE